MKSTLLLVLLALLALPAAAQEAEPIETTTKVFKETINIGVSSKEIAIAPDFAGTDVTIFGALDNVDPYLLAIGAYDIVVALEGPRDHVTLRKKESVFGIWLNRRSATFQWAPESYSIASTRLVENIAPASQLFANGVGINYIQLMATGIASNAETLREYRDAFIRLKQEHGLFQSNPGGVTFISNSLFQANIHIPSDIPNGVHTIKAFLFRSGDFVAVKELKLRVVKTGLEQVITEAAFNSPFLYGLFSVLLAVITGWTASLMFRRD
ncbi:MAG: hypothetical protein RLZZ444_473 [Pseudomonadota bacterium]